jgi:hypothetical protein
MNTENIVKSGLPNPSASVMIGVISGTKKNLPQISRIYAEDSPNHFFPAMICGISGIK